MKMTKGKQEQNDKMSCTNLVSHEGLQKFQSKLITQGLVSRWGFCQLAISPAQ